MVNVLETIKKRLSIRTYDGEPIENEKLQQLKDYLVSNVKGPFGNQVRFQIIDVTEAEKNELKQLGTYGNIKGPRVFIAGGVKKGNLAMEDFGYCMEKNILMATTLGLGTCWLGGSLNRSTFGNRLKISKDELVPAVTPLGYPADKRSMIDRFIRHMSGGDNRKNFAELFFNGDLSTPLNERLGGKYFSVLDAVRLAPSASNKQPWRIIKEKDRNSFHFYLKENSFYNNIFKDIKIQNIDLGIAICHFELAARELNLGGAWQNNEPKLTPEGLKYIGSWIG
jgi:nitroreductase